MAIVNGTGADDTLTGTAASDVLNGLAGNDALTDAIGGDDHLFGGDGDDGLTIHRDIGSNSGASLVLLDGGAGNDTMAAISGWADKPIEATFSGGAGADTITVIGYVRATIDAGDGDDIVNLFSTEAQTVTLGTGRDGVTIGTLSAAVLPPAPYVITDFAPGAGGDVLSMTSWLGQVLQGWDGRNPFATGFLRFVQSGPNTLLQIDVHGGAADWVPILQLNNVAATAITADNFETFSPAGSPPPGLVINGTDLSENLVGGFGDDTIHGFGGNDGLFGAAGTDWLYGGDDFDELGGSDGDRLYGEAGDDRLIINGSLSPENGTTLADGGDGFDLMQITFASKGQQVEAFGGGGNDTIEVIGPGHVELHGDAGHDRITLTGSDGTQTLYLGLDSDVVNLGATDGAPMLDLRDFQAGDGGDQLSVTGFLVGKLSGWQSNINPFNAGLLRLLDTVTGAELQYKVGTSWQVIALFEGVSAASFNANNLAGLDPSGGPLRNVIVGQDNEGVLDGTAIADLVFAGHGEATLNGGSGDDTLIGGPQGDVLNGGDGNDTLFGGKDGYPISNLLFGGSGADTFLFTAGTGNLLIGDFKSGVDHIEIHGFSGAPRIETNGIDTIIYLGGGDTIQVANVTQLSPGDLQVVAAELILPAPPAVGDAPISGRNLAIGTSGAEFIGKYLPITLSSSGNDAVSFDNYGFISATGRHTELIHRENPGFTFDLLTEDIAWNHAGATIYVHVGEGLGISNVHHVRNDGVIHLVGMVGSAAQSGVQAIAITRAFLVDNTGEIGLESRALGIGLSDVLNLNNSGLIRVKAEVACGVLLFGANRDERVVNTGTIEAVNYHGRSIGIGVQYRLNQFADKTVSDILNDGTIKADAAIYSVIGTERIANTGHIIGAIEIGDGNDSLLNAASGTIQGLIDTGTDNDRIVNQGIISGDVHLGDGNDLYDGTSGHLFGSLYGDAGDDILTGDIENNALNGGLGNDTLDGAAGIDVATYEGTRGSAMVTRNAVSHALTVSTGLDGTDTLRHVEQVKFADGLYSFTFSGAGSPVVANFNPAFGWASQDQYPRHVADVNGDGYADIVGFGTAGVLVSFGSAGGSFTGAAVKLADFGQNAGWASDNGFHRELADVNGDGRADILGFGYAGTLVSLAKADGTFGTVSTGITDFGVNQGWANQNGFARTVGDVNGDGKADLVGFGFAGALVALGNGNGTFLPVKTAIANFGVNQGWTSDNTFHRAVADVNGDGRADLVGFGIAGTYVALAKADGTFADAQLVLNDFGTSQGWASNDSFSRLVADVNGDHIADIVGFGIAGTLVAFGKGDGTFTQASLDVGDFGKNQGWSSDNTFHREVADMNKDGLADVVGFGIAGVLVGLNQGDFLI